MNYFQTIVNISRKYNDAIVKCEVFNEVGKSEETETLEVTCKIAIEILERPITVVKQLINSYTFRHNFIL